MKTMKKTNTHAPVKLYWPGIAVLTFLAVWAFLATGIAFSQHSALVAAVRQHQAVLADYAKTKQAYEQRLLRATNLNKSAIQVAQDEHQKTFVQQFFDAYIH